MRLKKKMIFKKAQSLFGVRSTSVKLHQGKLFNPKLISRVPIPSKFHLSSTSFSYSSKYSVPKSLLGIGSKVFNDQAMRTVCSKEVYDSFVKARDTSETMNKDMAEKLAKNIQEWAMDKGCTTFSHWYSPMRATSVNGERHDSFIEINFKTGDFSYGFSADRLFQGEVDGSSFPSGGLRTTHAAAAYTAWDMSSPPFIMNDVLYIPACFVAWTGYALDHKTPLLRSQDAINREGVRLLKLLGDNETKRVVSNVGWEQEFFIVDKNHYLKRPDLVMTGRTLIGALPARGQQSEMNYMSSIPLRVRDFLRDVEGKLWATGISVNTLHNEVAPGQHELSPIFNGTNIATDQNVLTVAIMNEAAARHGLAVLFHEKPFAGLNGSGKHNNWGLNTDTGANLYVPGKTQWEQERFMVMVAILCRALHLHADLVRVGITGAGNDHRLGAQEAPPSIISMYTGPIMEKHLNEIMEGGPLHGYGLQQVRLDSGTNSVAHIKKTVEDRNRTAPFPFCGNRWEFRAVGSSQNIALPLSLINAVVADSMARASEMLESGKSKKEVVVAFLKEHSKIIFNGNGYSEEWIKEAKNRKLWILPQTVDALKEFTSPKNIKLLSDMKIFDRHELEGRAHILYENYIKQIEIEASCLLEMMKTGMIPACVKDLSKLDDLKFRFTEQLRKEKDELYSRLLKETKILQDRRDSFPKKESLAKQADYCSQDIVPQMKVVRDVCDAIEAVLPRELYPYPKYSQLLYEHHFDGERIVKASSDVVSEGGNILIQK